MNTICYDNPIWGLPERLVTKERGQVPVIAMMRRYGLNREEKREFASTLKLNSIALPQITGLNEVERKILSIYTSPIHRLWGFWEAFHKLKDPKYKSGTRSIFRAPDYALLEAYSLNFSQIAFNKEALLRECPVWPEIAAHIDGQLTGLREVSKLDIQMHPEVFMVWLSIVDELSKWESLDMEKRVLVANTVFALSSISYSQWFVRDAIRRCSELADEFEPLLQLGCQISKSDSEIDKDVADKNLISSKIAVDFDGCDVGWQERWESLSDRLVGLSARLRVEPSLEAVNDLGMVYEDFQNLVQFLPPSTSVLAEQFESQLDQLLETLRSLQATECFNWLDESVMEQIRARWEVARNHATESDGLSDLANDFSRAEMEGGQTISGYRAEFENLVATREEIKKIERELADSLSSIQRRALQHKRTEKKKEEVHIESSLQTIETDVLTGYSPYGEVFDYSCNYVDLLNQETNQQAGIGDELDVSVEKESTDQVPLQQFDQAPVVTEQESGCIESAELTGFVAPKSTDQNAKLLSNEVPGESAKSQVSAPEPQIVISNDEPVESEGENKNVEEFSLEAGEVCRPLWLALSMGRASLAYHVTKALERTENAPTTPPSSLLASVCLADELVMPDGAIASALENYYMTLNEASFHADAPRAWQTALNLLLASATMRPILLSPRSGATAVARYLHLDAAHQGVYKLVQLLLNYSDRFQGFRLEEATFKQVKTQAAWQRESELLNRDVSDWLAQAPHMTMLFAAAGKVWHRWQKPGGLISDLLTPVASNDLRRIEEVKKLVAELGVAEGVHRRVHQTDRIELARRKGEEIHSRAMAQLVSRVEEAVGLSRRWIVLFESRPHDSDVLSNQLSQLRKDFTPILQQIESELSSQVEGDNWGLIAAARSVVKRSISGLLNLLDPEISGKLVEVSPDELLGRDLVFVSDVNLDNTWRPAVSGLGLIDAIQNALDRGLDIQYAFDKRIERHDLGGSERVCRVAEIELDPETASQIKALWLSELDHHRGMLQRQLDNVRSEIEDGLAYGFITEAERAEFDSRLVQYESSLDQVRSFGDAFIDLDSISETIHSGREAKTRAIEARLHELSELGTAAQSIEIVKNSINCGDVLSANEFLQRLENHESIEGTTSQAPDRFKEFFPGLANSIDTELQTVNSNQLKQMLREAKNFAGLDFSQLIHEAPMRQSAAEMVGAWMDMKARKRVDREPLSKLLEAVGFGVLDIQIGQAIGSRVECDLRAEPIDDRTVCPTPYFGSHANGRYRVVCVWQRPAEDEIVKLAGDSTISKPTLVLYFGRLSERKRRDASRLAKQNHRSFLLIDETLLIYLTAEPRSRLSALFEVGLPFAYSAPYDATSSVVPSEMFFGRTLELQAIQGQNGRCFIYGGRQLGKTALLRKAERSFHAPKNRRFARWIDLRAEGIGVNKAPSEIWQCIAREFRHIGLIPDDTPDPNPNLKGRIDGFISLLKQTLAANSDRRVLLLLDEADRFFDQDGRTGFQETARLKGLMEDTERRFKVVFAGLHNVLRMTERANHPLAHLGEPIKVGPLLEGQEWRDAEELIRRPFEAAGFEFESRSLVTRILAQTNYYPSLIQLYCTHLLRQMLSAIQADPRLQGPRYRITAKHIDAAYRSRALRDEIRTKFQLTLQLDPRYEVIAYTLAYGALDGWCSLTGGIQTRDIKARATRWWPEGFNETSDLEFRVLLDEMVGLGVLRQTREGWFSLRNPNVLLLLGTHDEIEDVLVKDREPPQEFESSAFRSRFPDDPSNVERNPLTFDQLSNLQRRRNAVTVLTGCAAGGIDEVIPFLRKFVEPKFLTVLDATADRSRFLKALDGLKDRASEGTTILMISGDVPWNSQWLIDAWKKVSGFSSKDKFAHVLFLADPATAFQTIQEESDIPEEVAGLTLHPWHDAFLRQWLEDCQLPNDPPNRRQVTQITGNWPGLLYMLARNVQGGSRLQDRLNTLNSAMDDEAYASDLRKMFGLDLAAPREVLTLLATLGEPTTEIDLSSLGEIDAEQVSRDLRWASFLGLARREGADSWCLDPVVQRLLKP